MGPVPEVQQAYREVVERHVDAPLRTAGFRRRGKAWYLETEASSLVPIVSLHELSRREEAIEFVLDWGVFSSAFCQSAFAEVGGKPSILVCPFSARLVPASGFGDQWWEVARREAWLVGADGSRRTTDFAEISAGVSRLLHLVSEIVTPSDLLRLMRSLVDRGEARATFTPRGSALLVLEQIELAQSDLAQSNLASSFDSPDWVTVETYDLDPDAATERDQAGDFQVTYADDVAVDLPDLVSESTVVISSFPGVSGVLQDDRETIKVWGSVDLVTLDLVLRRWWRTRLAERDDS